MAKKTKAEPVDVFKKFIDAIFDVDDPVFVGIDPGAHGAIALLCRRRCAVVDIPVIAVPIKRTRKIKEPEPGGPKSRTIHGNTTAFNNPAIIALFRVLRSIDHDRISVALEIAIPQVGGGAARNSTLVAYKTGIGYGMWPLFLAKCGYPVESIMPNIWKPAMGLGRRAKTGNSGKDSAAAKEASRAMALRLFPRADILRKSDHDRAEALLLAEYMRRRWHGESTAKRGR